MELDPSESDEDRDEMLWDDEEERNLETMRGMPPSTSSMVPNGDLIEINHGHMQQRYQGVRSNEDGTMSLTEEQCTVEFHRVPGEPRSINGQQFSSEDVWVAQCSDREHQKALAHGETLDGKNVGPFVRHDVYETLGLVNQMMSRPNKACLSTFEEKRFDKEWDQRRKPMHLAGREPVSGSRQLMRFANYEFGDIVDVTLDKTSAITPDGREVSIWIPTCKDLAYQQALLPEHEGLEQAASESLDGISHFVEQRMKDPERHAETVRMIHDMYRHANDIPLPETREDESDGDDISF